MSLARCSRAISAGDLIMRQPAVTVSALENSTAGASLRMPSNIPNRTRSSTPTRDAPASFSACAIFLYASSLSPATRTSPPMRADFSAPPCATHTKSPLAGITSAEIRSPAFQHDRVELVLRHQLLCLLDARAALGVRDGLHA